MGKGQHSLIIHSWETVSPARARGYDMPSSWRGYPTEPRELYNFAYGTQLARTGQTG